MIRTLTRSIVVAAALLTGMNAYAGVQSKAMLDDQPEFSTVASFDARIPGGNSLWTFTFDEAQPAAALSIWHVDQVGCRGFGIRGVRALGIGEDAQWVDLAPNTFDGITHFKALAEFKKIELALHSDRILAMNCSIMVRKANFMVPDVVTLLAKIAKPVCDSPASADDPAPVCSYTGARLDAAAAASLNFMKADFERFRLVADGIYKLTGYMKMIEDKQVFVIQASLRVM